MEQRIAEDTAKIEALRQASSIGIMDLEHGRLMRWEDVDLIGIDWRYVTVEFLLLAGSAYGGRCVLRKTLM
ncbi:putative transcriptional regulator, CopG/Arc/MetJ DNA-binding domain [Pseudomonas orientalis]|nr:putative transcriptional regulator, CopG/Arc/MetJ DNA-binding domain [Pseudomonas orientalis]